MRDLCARYGLETLRALMAASLDYGEAYMRAALSKARIRESSATILVEDDVTTDDPMTMKVAVRIEDDNSLTVDFTGSSAQRAYGMNCPAASTIGMTYYAAKVIFSPEVTQNEGCNRPLNIIVPEGCFLNPVEPAATSVRHITQLAVADLVLKALTPMMPQNAAAGCQTSFPTFTAGGIDDRPGARTYSNQQPYFLIADIISGGMGGYRGGDGLSAIDTHGGHCAILSAEVTETMSPVRVVKTELVPGSGGKGTWRGGLAISRSYEVLSEAMVLSGYIQQSRADTAAWGYEGGKNGQPSSAWYFPKGGDARKLKSKWVGLRLSRGDVVVLTGSGGGGWGPPEGRDPAQIARDLELGYITSDTSAP